MKITDNPLPPIEMRTANLEKMGEGRPSGLHLGEILTWGDIKLGRFKTLPDMNPQQAGLRMQAGFLWETAYEYACRRWLQAVRGQDSHVITQLEMVQVDGIWMTPDGLHVERQHLEEYKATWKSAKKVLTPELFQDHFPRWVMQSCAYCNALGVTVVDFFIFFMNGDYSWKPPYGDPHLRWLTLEFTPEEIMKNWALVCAWKDSMLRESEWTPH